MDISAAIALIPALCCGIPVAAALIASRKSRPKTQRPAAPAPKLPVQEKHDSRPAA